MSTVGEILGRLHDFAPPAFAQDYDNVGLLAGDPAKPVTTGLVALDLTSEVIDEAHDLSAELVVTHHPPIFKPIRSVRADDPGSALVYRLLRSDCAAIAAHTNLDAVNGGVSYALASQLGLIDVEPLERQAGRTRKLVAFVPAENADAVRSALAEAGAGKIGNYDSCAYESRGTGFFRPGADSSPAIGTAGGGLEHVDEVRLEVEVESPLLSRAIKALEATHPYEEVAYDVYSLQNASRDAALGVVGRLRPGLALSDFLSHVTRVLRTPSLRYAGTDDIHVKRVAVCGGSGRSLIGTAMSRGADAYVTADITYHSFFEPLNASGRLRMALVDAGHYETEACAEALLVDRLSNWFPEVDWQQTRSRTSPMRVFVNNHEKHK